MNSAVDNRNGEDKRKIRENIYSNNNIKDEKNKQ